MFLRENGTTVGGITNRVEISGLINSLDRWMGG